VGEHVDVVHQANLGLGVLQQWMAGHDAGIVDHHMDESVLLAHLLGQFNQLLALGNIAHISVGLASIRLDLLDGLVVGLLVNIPAQDGGTQLGILQGHLLAHSVASSGDQDHLAVDLLEGRRSEESHDGLEDGDPELDDQQHDVHHQQDDIVDVIAVGIAIVSTEKMNTWHITMYHNKTESLSLIWQNYD